MAKKHDMSMLSMYHGEKNVPLTNHVRIRFNLGYSCKHDGDAVSTDHNHKFDLEMSHQRFVEIFSKQMIVNWQNGTLRKMSSDNAKKKYPRGYVIKMDDVYPGRRPRREMTKEEMLEKISSSASKDEIQNLIAKLQGML